MKHILLIIVYLFICVWRGYVLSILWLWFVVPTFALPPLTTGVATGLTLIAGLLTHQFSREEEDADYGFIIVISGLIPLVTLGFAWVIHTLY